MIRLVRMLQPEGHGSAPGAGPAHDAERAQACEQQSAAACGLRSVEVYDAMFLAAKAASGAVDLPVMAWLSAGFTAWIKAGGDVPLERCLHLPAGSRRRQIARRNAWVKAASTFLQERSDYQTAAVLARELDRFLTRGRWPRWRREALPPQGCSDLEAALFFIAKANNGEGLSSRQLRRILGHLSPSICPQTSGSLEAQL